jgi:glycosyltransferase involved in cell wall biosynthesis
MARGRPWERMDKPLEPEYPPRFSAVIPTYNRADRVCRAIESVLHQTYRAAEVIVVDDGSRDATRERVRAYDGQVRYLFQDNAGAAAARNRGAREARFPWLAFLDSDDLWSPSYLERVAAAITETRGGAVLYFSDAEFEEFAPPRNRWTRVGFEAKPPHELLVRPADTVFAEGQPMLLPFSVFSRSTFLAEGGLWERLPAGEDTHLYVRLGLKYPMCAVSGIGGVVKGVPEEKGRLTGLFGPGAIRHWECSVLLWKDLLDRTPDLAIPYRRLLARRIADAYWRKGMLSARQFKPLDAIGSFSRSLLQDPSVALKVAAKKLGRH